MQQKILGFAILFLAIVGLVNLLKPELIPVKKIGKVKVESKFQPPLDINVQWRRDINELVKQGEIPKAWTSIREIRYIPLEEPLKQLVLQLNAPVMTKRDGEFALEVTLMSHVGDDGKSYVNFQHNIIDLENDNTLWELNRTYSLISDKK